MKRVRVLVIDDSPTMRAIIIKALQADPRIEVVAQAVDAYSARQAIRQLQPDVITLDIEMPSMDGLEFLTRLMRLHAMPVLMISGVTQRNVSASAKALELGALDCIAKPTNQNPHSFEALPAKVLAASKARVRSGTQQVASTVLSRSKFVRSKVQETDLIAIGASMGGVDALIEVLSTFPQDCPATMIVQHMPQGFTQGLIKRLGRYCAANVCEAERGAPVEPGHIYFASRSDRHLIVEEAAGLKCGVCESGPEHGHRPSVDVLFRSVAKAVGKRARGVILTGMGVDGAAGLLEMRKAGAYTIGQDEKTSTIYGMPKAAYDCGAVQKQVPLSRVSNELFTAAL